jgi:putative DNA primase/helicase
VETLKLIIPQQDTPARRLIGFRNGVLDTKSGIFSPHHKSHWLRTLCDVDFTRRWQVKRWRPTPAFLALARPAASQNPQNAM